jgi:hypothetical protein
MISPEHTFEKCWAIFSLINVIKKSMASFPLSGLLLLLSDPFTMDRNMLL